MKQAHRFNGPGQAYEGLTEMGPAGPRWNGKIRLVPEAIAEPMGWRKPCRVFVNSMSDLFHEDVPDEFLLLVFGVMANAREHTFQVLTKRPKRMRDFVKRLSWKSGFGFIQLGERTDVWANLPYLDGNDDWEAVGPEHKGPGAFKPERELPNFVAPNVWLGVSAENQKTADERIPLLLDTPAVVRFVSAEPLLGPIDLCDLTIAGGGGVAIDALNHGPSLSWVIVGGESGHQARPMHPDWARSIRDQCAAAGVPYFFKQWGEWTDYRHVGANGWERVSAPTAQALRGRLVNGPLGGQVFDTRYPWQKDYPGPCMVRVGKKAAGRELDGRTWDQFPTLRTEAVSA